MVRVIAVMDGVMFMQWTVLLYLIWMHTRKNSTIVTNTTEASTRLPAWRFLKKFWRHVRINLLLR